MRQDLYSIALGGLAFWAPAVLLSAIYKWDVSTLALNLASVASLALVSLISWIIRKRMPKWGWVLAGVYILGPTAILAASAFSRFPSSSPGLPGDPLRLIVLCLIPPVTLWFATLNGMIFSVLFVTLILPALSLLRAGKQQASR
jgi:hypothetical protein